MTDEPEKTLLIVEDDVGLQKQLKWCFESYRVVVAEDRATAIAALRRYTPAVVLQDLGLPPDPAGTLEGLATVNEILRLAPHVKVIVMTGNADKDSAVKAIGLGAWDFLQKPVDTDLLRLIVDRAFHVAGIEERYRALIANGAPQPNTGIIAVSDGMLQLCRRLEKVAPADVSVLVLGESGTGKELLAKALHELSPRRSKRFIAINCAAIPENLLESELFGYEKGAFTGAARQTPGKIESAHQGTLFLDEIGDMAPALQAKLLRFLQERRFERVGGREEIEVDVRVVCATNRDLDAMLEQSQFRPDLYYRISEVTLRIPPLRERQACIPVLARFLLQKHSAGSQPPKRGFTPDALDAMQSHAWPGNVRQLESCIKSAVIMADGAFITAEDLGLVAGDGAASLNLREVRLRADRSAVRQALAMAEGNISKAADLLGITRPTLYDLMEKLAVKVPA